VQDASEKSSAEPLKVLDAGVYSMHTFICSAKIVAIAMADTGIESHVRSPLADVPRGGFYLNICSGGHVEHDAARN
jgi:hypothetical protein